MLRTDSTMAGCANAAEVPASLGQDDGEDSGSQTQQGMLVPAVQRLFNPPPCSKQASLPHSGPVESLMPQPCRFNGSCVPFEVLCYSWPFPTVALCNLANKLEAFPRLLWRPGL